jgi:hypothetical protein
VDCAHSTEGEFNLYQRSFFCSFFLILIALLNSLGFLWPSSSFACGSPPPIKKKALPLSVEKIGAMGKEAIDTVTGAYQYDLDWVNALEKLTGTLVNDLNSETALSTIRSRLENFILQNLKFTPDGWPYGRKSGSSFIHQFEVTRNESPVTLFPRLVQLFMRSQAYRELTERLKTWDVTLTPETMRRLYQHQVVTDLEEAIRILDPVPLGRLTTPIDIKIPTGETTHWIRILTCTFDGYSAIWTSSGEIQGTSGTFSYLTITDVILNGPFMHTHEREFYPSKVYHPFLISKNESYKTSSQSDAIGIEVTSGFLAKNLTEDLEKENLAQWRHAISGKYDRAGQACAEMALIRGLHRLGLWDLSTEKGAPVREMQSWGGYYSGKRASRKKPSVPEDRLYVEDL